MKISFDRNETELKQRKEQIYELVSKYTDKIAVLEAKLEEHSDAMNSSDDKVETFQAQFDRKDEKIRELLISVAEMESKLESASRSKESAKLKSEALSKDLDEKESKLRNFEVEKIELETKLHTQARSKDEARAKMSELSSRLERKEREVREVSDRYKIYVMELESKLDQDTDTKHHLQLEIDELRNNLDSAGDVSTEALELRQKVNALEMNVASSNETTASIQSKLEEASKSRKAIDAALHKANEEKAEVIAALEGVINEVQNREDEIESLSELLQRRDEELQHAKIIATKALASAKDIQKRYKDKTEGRHSNLMGRMNDVSDNVDRLTTKNESLQRKISSLERDLRDRNLECKRLKDQLRQIDARQMRENIKDDISAISTQSTEFTAFSNQAQSDEGVEDDHRQLQFSDSGSFSPTNRTRNANGEGGNLNESGFSRHVEFPSIDEQYSKDSIENSTNGGTKWQDFDSDSRSGFESVSSEQQSTKSRRSVERDALRKYFDNDIAREARNPLRRVLCILHKEHNQNF
jgi:chromosome segregation ATPase